MKQELTLAFIGAGNMAEALVKGLLRTGAYQPGAICLSDPDEARREEFSSRYGVSVMTDNREAAAGADAVVLAVKPQVMTAVLEELQEDAGDRLYISIAAGLPTAAIEAGLGGSARVVRVMPNTPALVGAGAAAVCAGKLASEEDVALAESLMASVGMAVRVKEADMDAVTALSGSGPAYVFHLMEAMLSAGDRMGLDPDVALRLAAATVAGAGQLVQESGISPDALRERVTSKGGTTAAALHVLKEQGFFEAVVDAVLAAQVRSKELSEST